MKPGSLVVFLAQDSAVLGVVIREHKKNDAWSHKPYSFRCWEVLCDDGKITLEDETYLRLI